MKQLKDILFGVGIIAVSGDTGVDVPGLQFDSRKVRKGELFVAFKGTLADGHDYIPGALKAGAVAVVCEHMPEELVPEITYVQVNDSQEALSVMASNYYDRPSSQLKLVGVTGTNGKTTVTSLCYEVYTQAGYQAGLLSTNVVRIGSKEYPATHTTPDPIQINHHLHEMVAEGVEYCFMEVSSHGIHQKRIAGLDFTGAVFTNLTHDHLDYHGSFAAYRDTKKKLFDGLGRKAFALVNTDDKNGIYMLQNTPARKYTYALKGYADYRGQLLESQFTGQLLKIEDQELWTQLIGEFNAYNVLCVYAIADLLDMERMERLRLLSELQPVQGRFQYIQSPQKIHAIVDYAHTPDALKNVLTTVSALRTGNEKVIAVVGCGGDRDRSKRPVMGHIAASMSDQSIFTSDNPRSESPSAILQEMQEGVGPELKGKVLVIEDRRQAIRTAVRLAESGDILLVAGKGHETYQEIDGVRHPFDDMKELQRAFNQI